MKYFDKIDGLRFVAIVFVLIEHFADKIGQKITAGYFGVDLFFVISGFLITNILINSKHPFLKSYKNFVGRRTLRIFPIYYLFLAFMWAVGYEPCRDNILYLATYTFNYAWAYQHVPMSSITHCWSLAVEEQFYLFWPILVLALRRWPLALKLTTVAIVVLCFFQLSTQYFQSFYECNFVGLFPRAGSLCLGALGAMLHQNRALMEDFFKNILLEWVVLAALVTCLLIESEIKYTILPFCSLFLVLKSANADFSIGVINRFLTNRKVLYVGGISYGIYLFHLPLGVFITTKFVSPIWYSIDFESLGAFSFLNDALWVVALPVYALLSIGLATLSSRYVEKPILSLKDRFFK